MGPPYDEDSEYTVNGPHETTFTKEGAEESFNTFARRAGPRVNGATYGKPVCLLPEEVEQLGIPDEDITVFDDADDAECDRSDLVSLPVALNRTVERDTWAELPDAVGFRVQPPASNEGLIDQEIAP